MEHHPRFVCGGCAIYVPWGLRDRRPDDSAWLGGIGDLLAVCSRVHCIFRMPYSTLHCCSNLYLFFPMGSTCCLSVGVCFCGDCFWTDDLLPHFVLGIFLIVGKSSAEWDGGIFALILCSVLLLIPTIYWSRALSRFAKESKWLSKIWGFANKYVKNNRGAKKRLKKLIDELSTPPPLIPERIKNIFRRS